MTRDDFEYMVGRIDFMELSVASIINKIDRLFAHLEVMEVEKMKKRQDLARMLQVNQYFLILINFILFYYLFLFYLKGADKSANGRRVEKNHEIIIEKWKTTKKLYFVARKYSRMNKKKTVFFSLSLKIELESEHK